MKGQAGLKRICIICFFAMLVMFVIHMQILVMFNRQEMAVHGNDSSSKVYMEIDPRASDTSKWLKRDYQLTEDRKVDLTGQTIDETLHNNSADQVRDWKLRIDITGDCFINQAWTGTVEIHQFVESGHEAVQTIDLQDYELEDIRLEHLYDGDLLIPLQKGDYLIYNPNEHYTEIPVRSKDKVTIGMIFYYLDELDLSNYDLTLRLHRGFTQGWSFIAFVVMAVLWVLSSVMYATSVFTYRNAQKQMELRRSGLSYMSELYEAIYIINLPTGEMTPVFPGEYIEQLREKYGSAKELLPVAVRGDSEDGRMEAVLAFVDTDTLDERLKDRESIVCEFLSKIHGWCRFRFFAMERTEGKPLEDVIFAVQDINDERVELQNLTDRLAKAESTATANNDFLSGASRDLRAPVLELMALDEQILSETDPERIRRYAQSIRSTMDRMLTLINALSDRAAVEAGEGKALEERYCLGQLTEEALGAVQPIAERKGIRLESEVSESIPDALIGDRAKLREVMVSMLANILNHSAGGSVRLSVFGKLSDKTVHLLFSARAIPEEQEPSGSVAGAQGRQAEPDLDLEVAGSLLPALDSELKSVRSPDAWKDIYFEIDQRIADPAPEERATAEDMKQ